MKIAVILPSLINKAPIQVALDIVDELVKNGCQVDIYYFKSIIDFDCKNRCKISFFTSIDFNSYDIIHSHTFIPDLYIWFNRRYIKTTVISTLHNEIDKVLVDLKGKFLSRIYSKLWVKSLKSFSRVVCLSHFAETQMKEKYNFTNTTHIYNGRSVNPGIVGIDDTELFSKLSNNYIIIGVVANLTKIKGIEQILYSLTLQVDYALVVIGEGKERSNLEKMVNSLNLKNRCVFLGYRPHAHLYMKYFDIYVMSSRSEGFPLVLIEAAQYSKPIACSDLEIFREFFNDDEVAFFHLDDKESLSTAIEKLYSNRNDYSIKVYNKFSKMYTKEIMGRNYLKLYNMFS